MADITADKKKMDLQGFLEKFIFFHLGRDAEVDISRSSEQSVSCSIQHSRIEPMSIVLDPEQVQQFSEDLPAFEDFLLELLTRNRRGNGIGD